MFRQENILKKIRDEETGFPDESDVKMSRKLLKSILKENPALDKIMNDSRSVEEFRSNVRKWVEEYIQQRETAHSYYLNKTAGIKAFEMLSWKDVAAIRILDYLDYEGKEFKDMNLRGVMVKTEPFKIIWEALKDDRILAGQHFFRDFLYLMRQYNGSLERKIPAAKEVETWMEKWPSGLDTEIVKLRNQNRDRIIRILIKWMDEGRISRSRFHFDPEMSKSRKYEKMLEWWKSRTFHLQFAIRTPSMLNELLDNSLDDETMKTMQEAADSGIPFFINPYYLSLLNVNAPDFAKNADYAIRDYIFVSRELVDEYGHIVAWEKEDIVEQGEPNAAGWLLPHAYNIHRRYPEVAILIPDTVGRACGGLCVSCQRMYNFQSGHLNFNLNKLRPQKTWWTRFPELMEYFETDSQLRDILITGGDALMSSDKSLKRILDGVLEAAMRKKEQNTQRAEGEKYAEMLRIRLGTRLPVYLPQRITGDLIGILADFRKRATKAGFRQFVIQTHFESPMEITPEAKKGIEMLLSAGWIVTNQLVFTAAASMRGHTAKLRKDLNDIGVLTYYTFTVKGYAENSHSFANNARAVQEQIEEKAHGVIPEKYYRDIEKFPAHPEKMKESINALRMKCNLPFLATDRNVLNLPGVGKSLTFRTIGITNDGRRILLFDHDRTRKHSPIIEKLGKLPVIESRSISGYLEKIASMGEDTSEYESVWGYSIGETEPRMPIYKYPEYNFKTTGQYTNLKV